MLDAGAVPVSGTAPLLLLPPGAYTWAVSGTAQTVYLGAGTPLTVSNGFPVLGNGIPVTMPSGYTSGKGGQVYAFLPGGGTVTVSYWLSTPQ